MTSENSNPKESRPWSPKGIALVSLLLSPLPGGVLHALNYARLGVPARKRLALFSNLITGVALLAIPFWIEAPFVRLAAALFASAYFYKSQERLFQAHRSGGGQKASFVLPVVLTLVAALLLFGLYHAIRLLLTT